MLHEGGRYQHVDRMTVVRFLALLIFVCAGCVAFAVGNPDFDRARNLARERYGVEAEARIASWIDLIASSGMMSEHERLLAVNAFFNRHVVFADDSAIWGQPDYWATPLEALGRGMGDCEDYSIGKYATLVLMGIPVERMRITYVRAEAGLPGSGISQAHMVLAYYAQADAQPLVLDNLLSEVRPASRRPDLHPVFGFNSEGLWLGSAAVPAARDPTARLSRWRDVLRRMALEGLH